MSEQFSYTQAIREIENILRELQSDTCDIDTMVAKTRRAADLIRMCRERLTATEEELRAVNQTLTPNT